MLTQQQSLLIRYVITVICGGGVALGVLPKAWADWLSSDATFTVIFAAFSLGTLAWGWIKTRPKNVVISAGQQLQKEGGVIVAPAKYADSSKAPDNVVKTLDEAAIKLGSGS